MGNNSWGSRHSRHPKDADSADPDVDPLEFTREIALRRLEQRDYSRGELQDYLVRRRRADPQLAGRVLDRLEAVGLVDDARFAAAWVDSRRRTKQLSRRALAQELRSKAISDDLISAVLDQIDTDQEHETALTACRVRASRMHGVNREVAFRRLAGALARKGYPSSTVVAVVSQVLDETVEQA
ncbi:regulatory protein RecX [Propionibacterium sp.]|uniref:regulatory protein RecX n=1 Tax=Propionibacterium sp. TaxID=1977903 RepID=UPI0039EB766F